MARDRSPGMKLLMAGLVAAVLIVPLMLVYALVYDRESQSQRAQAQITQGWGGAQVVTGPVLVIPFLSQVVETEIVDGQTRERSRQIRQELFVSPLDQQVETSIDPDRKGYAIYESVVYQSTVSGNARFSLTDELARLDIERSALQFDQAELRFGVSDPRGLTESARVTVGGQAAQLSPGSGPAATGGSGFSTPVEWDGEQPLAVAWEYGLRGSRSFSLVPRGAETRWKVTSSWPHPSFVGGFVPSTREISDEGFAADYGGITNIGLNRPLLSLADEAAPGAASETMIDRASYGIEPAVERMESPRIATIGLTDPVDVYSQVDRAVKYGFLFIGFTFAMFLMFDIVGGAKVAGAEYLLTGAGLVLFFVMLLAFAEVWGFTAAYVFASAAVIGLLTAYSAAVLGTWKRAGFVGAMLAGLYSLLFVLLGIERYSLVIGAMLLFLALAGIMYGTRNIDWSAVRRGEEDEAAYA